VALGVASASEIASASNVRREEVYRIVPELEKRGIVVRKLDAPRKFSAVKPEAATSLLMKDKLKTMKDEVDSLTLKQLDLVPRLKSIAVHNTNNDCSLELISKAEVAAAKLMDMTIRARKQIDLITSPREFRMAYTNRSKSLRDRLLRTVHLRVIFPEDQLDSSIRDIIRISERNKNKIEVRHMEKIPFNLLISDEKEAMWGDAQPTNGNVKNLWTDDPTQVNILMASFDSLWQKSKPYE
jgi:sugar-specific transcriptional regulator TrmB